MNKIHLLFLLAIVGISCVPTDQPVSFVVSNALSFERNQEVIQVPIELIVLKKGQQLENFGIADEMGNLLSIQYVDNNQDEISDGILFQPTVPANGQSKFFLKELGAEEEIPTSMEVCYSRFVPERTDDYSWENDKVAFRMFGPTAQQMKEEGAPGGTLTSGIDCWLKKVEYPIINKWYKKYESDPNAYHVDSGEGLDNFHVGISRGCGGIAVKQNDEFYTSKNFTSFKTLSKGPLKTAFELNYSPWSAGDSTIIETTKKINLDKSSQLSRIEVNVKGAKNIWAGLTLHENDGQVTVDSLGAWVSYYQPHGDSYLATALLAAPGFFSGSEVVLSEEKDLSHAYLNLAVNEGKAVYYAGFYWQESGQFEDNEAWELYLTQFSAQLADPLVLSQIN
ncbi:MAG: DUF4861 family protein [Reichenbachiella sp.]|uniref:DUF4861 family protein n=1 Tax=Reichenbachiella sp. TaxID=2184521 RepID=UPI003265A02D